MDKYDWRQDYIGPLDVQMVSTLGSKIAYGCLGPLINTMVSLRSWDFPKLSTSKWSTLRGRISKMVVSIANSFGDLICRYHKFVPVVL